MSRARNEDTFWQRLKDSWLGRTVKNIGGVISGDNQRELQELQRRAAEEAYLREQHSAQTAMDFSASEAQKNRDWQAEMSNTAHQRQMADLKAAGLNPILAAQGGAPIGSGSMGTGFAASAQQASVSTENQALRLLTSALQIVSKILE